MNHAPLQHRYCTRCATCVLCEPDVVCHLPALEHLLEDMTDISEVANLEPPSCEHTRVLVGGPRAIAAAALLATQPQNIDIGFRPIGHPPALDALVAALRARGQAYRNPTDPPVVRPDVRANQRKAFQGSKRKARAARRKP